MAAKSNTFVWTAEKLSFVMWTIMVANISASPDAQYHVELGRHSNIPECCIRYFIGDWENEWPRKSTYSKMLDRRPYGYVPCPDCFMRDKKVKLHMCDDSCKK